MNRTLVSTAACVMLVAGSVTTGSAAGCVEEPDAVQAIERYCAVSWDRARIAAQDRADCTQQVFCQLLERISRSQLPEAIHQTESEERRELNRAIWATAKRWQRARRHVPLAMDTDDSRHTRTATIESIRATIADCLNDLPPRQKAILQQLLDGASVAEIAESLEIPASRVSDEKYKALARLRRQVC